MGEPADDLQVNQTRWRALRPTALWLTLAWALLTFVPPFFARGAGFEFAGASLAVWIAAQIGPLLYVLLAWLYERRASRLDALRPRSGGD
ncbi:MAG TPA: sodium/substrate symporter small subunit [Burkholderiaceae bacterium]|nr:sodium/substrate symporter small subunit [Burkholderiaceae bacterium]